MKVNSCQKLLDSRLITGRLDNTTTNIIENNLVGPVKLWMEFILNRSSARQYRKQPATNGSSKTFFRNYFNKVVTIVWIVKPPLDAIKSFPPETKLFYVSVIADSNKHEKLS